MFTETLMKRSRRFAWLDLLTGPHGVDRYTELVDPTWTRTDARAKVVAVRRQTPRSVTLILEPNRAFTGFSAGQHINVTVEINGRRRTRCYSPASADHDHLIELTIGRHDGGLVSTHLCDNAAPGMIVGLDSVGGDFTLPRGPHSQRPRKILFVSGGSGITPVMSMLRTLVGERARGEWAGEIAFIHYARTPGEACYRIELDRMRGVKVLHGYTRRGAGDLTGRFDSSHLEAAMTEPHTVFVCGPPALVDAVRRQCAAVVSESFVPPAFAVATEAPCGTVAFADSGFDVVDDGRSLLEQAEAAGLTPESGCRMGICHTCTRTKTSGAVRNLITGAVSSSDEEDVQICVTAPVGDVNINL